MAVAPPTESSRRSSFRWPPVGCLGCGSLPLLAAALYLVWANWLPSDPPLTPPMPQPNGYDAVQAALAKLHVADSQSPLGRTSVHDPTMLRPLLAQDASVLEEIRAALRMEYLSPPARNVADETVAPDRARDAGRKFAAQSRAALAEGHAGEAAQDALDALELGGAVGRGAGVIPNLVGCGLTATTARALEPAIPRLTAGEAHAAGMRMDRLLPRFPRTADALEEERLGLRASMLLLFRGELDQAAIDKNAPPASVQRVVWFVYPKPWALANVDRTLRGMAHETGKPYPQQHAVAIAGDFFSKTFLPVLKPFPRAMLRRDALIGIMRTEVALREYRARRGQYPARLQELSPDYLPAVPADPYGSGPLSYRREGAGYVLYSWGADGKDDGGRPVERSSLEEIVPGDLAAGYLTPPASPRSNGGTP